MLVLSFHKNNFKSAIHGYYYLNLINTIISNYNFRLRHIKKLSCIFQMAGAPMPESGKIGQSSKSKGMSDEEIEAQLAKLKG